MGGGVMNACLGDGVCNDVDGVSGGGLCEWLCQ